jgi:hypothetical protein
VERNSREAAAMETVATEWTRVLPAELREMVAALMAPGVTVQQWMAIEQSCLSAGRAFEPLFIAWLRGHVGQEAFGFSGVGTAEAAFLAAHVQGLLLCWSVCRSRC